ncbi:hypothetical protein AKO1_006138 [Acrasis kona]|uniref:Uncharacterized protein n=1 Tax=Acrasis kona TaxID=1008807 RepID=A0AAW2YI56_9EUKA
MGSSLSKKKHSYPVEQPKTFHEHMICRNKMSISSTELFKGDDIGHIYLSRPNPHTAHVNLISQAKGVSYLGDLPTLDVNTEGFVVSSSQYITTNPSRTGFILYDLPSEARVILFSKVKHIKHLQVYKSRFVVFSDEYKGARIYIYDLMTRQTLRVICIPKAEGINCMQVLMDGAIAVIPRFPMQLVKKVMHIYDPNTGDRIIKINTIGYVTSVSQLDNDLIATLEYGEVRILNFRRKQYYKSTAKAWNASHVFALKPNVVCVRTNNKYCLYEWTGHFLLQFCIIDDVVEIQRINQNMFLLFESTSRVNFRLMKVHTLSHCLNKHQLLKLQHQNVFCDVRICTKDSN